MEADLKTLELKIAQLITAYQAAQTHNGVLTTALNQAQTDNLQLKNNMALASDKLSLILQHLPEETA
jgi:hypothetical protein